MKKFKTSVAPYNRTHLSLRRSYFEFEANIQPGWIVGLVDACYLVNAFSLNSFFNMLKVITFFLFRCTFTSFL